MDLVLFLHFTPTHKLILVICITTAAACHLDFYQVSHENETVSCEPCTVCDPGDGVKVDCLEKSDTVCRKCGKGEYSEREWDKRVCVKCTNCAAFSRITLKPCSSLNNTVCGDCVEGLVSGENGEECISPKEQNDVNQYFGAIPDTHKSDSMSEIAESELKRDFITRDEFFKIQIIAAVSMAAIFLTLAFLIVKMVAHKHQKRCPISVRSRQDQEILIHSEEILPRRQDNKCQLDFI